MNRKRVIRAGGLLREPPMPYELRMRVIKLTWWRPELRIITDIRRLIRNLERTEHE